MVKLHPTASGIRHQVVPLQPPAFASGPAEDIAAAAHSATAAAATAATTEFKSLRGLIVGGRFRILDQASIGQGSGGEVWAAMDEQTGETVAVKALHRARVKERQREAAAASDPALGGHALLVPPRAAVVDARFPATVFVSTTLQPGGDLRNMLHRDGAFPLRRARSALADLLVALDFLHAPPAALCHRDVKPENLYWDGSTLRLGDFGLARPLPTEEERRVGRLMTPQMVTLWYRAPEVLLGATEYGLAVDIFSAGAVFAELLTGRPVFKGRTEVDILARIFAVLGKPRNRPGDWPPDLAAAIDHFAGRNDAHAPPLSRDYAGAAASSSSTSFSSSSGHATAGDGAGGEPWGPLAEVLPFGTPAVVLDLLVKLLAPHPLDRPSAAEALQHPFLFDEPKAARWRAAKHQAKEAAAAVQAAAAEAAAGPLGDAAAECCSPAAAAMSGGACGSEENESPLSPLLGRGRVNSLSLTSLQALTLPAVDPFADDEQSTDAAVDDVGLILAVPAAPACAPASPPPPPPATAAAVVAASAAGGRGPLRAGGPRPLRPPQPLSVLGGGKVPLAPTGIVGKASQAQRVAAHRSKPLATARLPAGLAPGALTGGGGGVGGFGGEFGKASGAAGGGPRLHRLTTHIRGLHPNLRPYAVHQPAFRKKPKPPSRL